MNFIRKITSLIYLILSLIVLTYIIYKSEIIHQGQKRDYFIVYYFASSILIIFSVLTFYLNKKLKDYFFYSISFFIISVFLLEIYLDFKNNKIKLAYLQKVKDERSLIFEKKYLSKFDDRDKYEIFDNLKNFDDNISLFIKPNRYLLDNKKIFPLSGISFSKTIFCNQAGFYSIYQSDRYGFNNPDKEWESEEVEYLLIGDSFVQGACVNRPDDMASKLRKVSKKKVLNLGYYGNGPLIEYAVLREYLKPNVKKIIWFYFEGNDLTNLKSELKNHLLLKYYNDPFFSQNLRKKQNKIDDLGFLKIEEDRYKKKFKEQRKITKLFKLPNLRGYMNKFLPEKNKPKIGIPLKEMKNILNLAKKISDENNSELYFVYLPTYERYKFSNFKSEKMNLKKITNELKIEFLDIDEIIFKKAKNPKKLFSLGLGYHYNEKTYEKISKKIYNLTK
jgi:hypothetical protein